MTEKELDQPLFPIDTDNKKAITIRQSFEGISIFGGTGAGKTSGSGKTIALSMLKKGWGGLVLTVKPDERELWEYYAKRTGRKNDLVIIDAECNSVVNYPAINLLDYEFKKNGCQLTFTQEIVSLLNTAMAGGQEIRQSTDPFWDDATNRFLLNAVDLAVFANEKLDLENVVQIIRDVPFMAEAKKKFCGWASGTKWEGKCNFLIEALTNMRNNREKFVEKQIDCVETINYWTKEFPHYPERTSASLLAVLMSKLSNLLRSPYRQLFAGKTTVIPEYTFGESNEKGKIIVLDLPVKKYAETGRFAQVLFKLIWQRAVERRGKNQGNPVFLWADEAQYFVTKNDMLFQQTARASRVVTVYLTQSIANYKAALGDTNQSSNITDSLMANFQTVIFHANGCPVTNEYASRLLGKNRKDDAERIPYLKKGGIQNEYVVEGYVIQAGNDDLSRGKRECEFNQKAGEQ